MFNKIESISKVEFPDRLKKLGLRANNIKSIDLTKLPSSLKSIDLFGIPNINLRNVTKVSFCIYTDKKVYNQSAVS